MADNRKLQGYRKMVVFGGCIAALVAGLAITKGDPSAVGLYTPFAAAVVAIGGWFFKSNVDTHKAQATGGGA